MSEQNKSKINRLEQLLPEGLLVDASWLEERGYYRSLRAKYVSSGWLEQPVRGVYRRPRGELGWEQLVISLQTLLELPVSIGGRTALELQGHTHYVSPSQQSIHLYSDEKLPAWLDKLPLEQVFIRHNRQRFLPPCEQPNEALSLDQTAPESKVLKGALRVIPWGQWNWPLVMSTPERAYLELLDELPRHETFHMADVIMEGLVNLGPRRMQALLEQTTSIKVKRLFLFFADRHRHQWFSRIDQDAIDLGSGKRVLEKGGKLDPVYQITVSVELSPDFTLVL
ncbi:MAG: type IV toxin-antitoxin system AbiEi family antitoxin domain-containing protein [Gammaproteobacteria bacterium]|nr:type IV toxin-antitoxin system AbiEi family antitoxin domain-containing protein [Gammaproteobacteria bacterium]